MGTPMGRLTGETEIHWRGEAYPGAGDERKASQTFCDGERIVAENRAVG